MKQIFISFATLALFSACSDTSSSKATVQDNRAETNRARHVQNDIEKRSLHGRIKKITQLMYNDPKQWSDGSYVESGKPGMAVDSFDTDGFIVQNLYYSTPGGNIKNKEVTQRLSSLTRRADIYYENNHIAYRIDSAGKGDSLFVTVYSLSNNAATPYAKVVHIYSEQGNTRSIAYSKDDNFTTATIGETLRIKDTTLNITYDGDKPDSTREIVLKKDAKDNPVKTLSINKQSTTLNINTYEYYPD